MATASEKIQKRLPRRPSRMGRTPRNDGECSRFDLEWDDSQLFPEVVYPDTDFLLRRMNEATLQSVDAKRGELILDIGCGRGIDGVELAKKGAVVIGLEPSLMMINHARNHISKNRANMSLVRGVGENLPFRAQFVDKVVCKGALDHFPEPAVVIEQIALVLKPRGKAIIAVANFDSLGFKLGRAIWQLRKMFGFKVPECRMPWEVPEDHTYKFDYSFIKRLIDNCLQVEQISGVSLLFGLPWWGMFLAKCPKAMSLAILNFLDKVARHLPSLSDVVILKCRPR
ncbi:MAG TPA: methyltransferase domain-containing protein [Dehalococcoidia bacterium]